MNVYLMHVYLKDKPSTSEENIVMQAESNDQAKTIQGKLKNVQKNKVITRRGSTILKASRRPTRKEVIDRVSDIASGCVRENRDDILDSDMNDEELDAYIKSMIQNKLMITDSAPKKTMNTKSKKITTKELSLEERMHQRQRELDLNDEDD